MSEQDTPSRDEFFAKWIPRLPQAARIRPEDAARWYDDTLARDPDRFHWHFQRLFGFGGSDVGEIGAWELGVPALFNTVESIVSQKLLRRSIEPANKYTRRGSLLEDDFREMFLQDFNARSRTDLADSLRNARLRSHPWARANPDDVVEMRSGGKKKIFLVDYKAPSEVKDQAPTQYACQTHHYDWMLWAAEHDGAPRLTGNTPLATDGLLIVSYDYAAAEIVPINVPWDGAILGAVISGGDKTWEHLLGQRQLSFVLHRGEDPSGLEALGSEEEAHVGELERQIVGCKLLADYLYKRYRTLTGECEKLLYDSGRRTKSRLRPPFSCMSVTYQSAIDDERLRQLCRLAQVDIESLRVDTKSLDAEAMAARLQALGEKPLYQRALDLKRIASLCAEHSYRSPINETGVWKLSQRRAVQEALGPLRERAQSEAERALRLLIDITAQSAAPQQSEPVSHSAEVRSLPTAKAGPRGGLRLLSLPQGGVTPGRQRAPSSARRRGG
jgi:hypothetical protein